MNISKSIRLAYCENFKDKIIENENYNDFISSFSKDRIEKIYKIASIMDDNNKMLSHVMSLSIHPKKVIVDDFIKNKKDIYKIIVSNASIDILNQLNIFINRNNGKVITLSLDNLNYSINFIKYINDFFIAKVKLIKINNILEIYSPEEITNILKEILKDKNIKEKSKKNSEYYNKINSLVATYGVIRVKDLTKIYNKVFEKTTEKNIIDSILINIPIRDNISIVKLDDDYLIYNLEFEDEDNAITFYYSLSKKIDYKIFTKKEYEEIEDGIYHTNFIEYDNLIDFLVTVLNMEDDELDYFDDMFILDYMYSYQTDKEVAKKKLNSKLNTSYGYLEFSDKAYICSSILKIAKNYPNYNYKGYSYNEINNKAN